MDEYLSSASLYTEVGRRQNESTRFNLLYMYANRNKPDGLQHAVDDHIFL